MLGDDALICSPAAGGVGEQRPGAGGGGRARPTSRSTCSARPGCCWPGPGTLRRPAGTRTRTPWPTCAPRPSSATSRWPSCPTTSTSPARSPGCCCSRPGGWRCCTGCSAPATRCVAAVAGKGVKELDLPPRLRRPLDAAARRRHRGVAPAHAGGARRGLALRRGAVPHLRRRAPAGRRRGGGRSGGDPRGGRRACSTRCSPRHAGPPARSRRPGPIGGRGGRQGLHTEHLGHVLAVMQSLARQHPGATW